MNISFDNTEIAFKHQSSSDLLKAKRLFQLFSNSVLVDKGPLLANFGLSIGLPIKGLLKRTVFHQFCGGEDIESSYASAKELYESGIGAILDYSVEGEGSEKSFQRSFKELSEVIKYASKHPEFPFAVFKCSCLGSIEVMRKITEKEVLTEKDKKRYEEFKTRVDALCQLAFDLQVKLFIDAEESWIQDAIDELCYSMMRKYNIHQTIVFNTIQLYRKGRIEEIEKQIDLARKSKYYLGFKLVRGAYMEKEAERAEEKGYPNPIQDSKEDTDRDYNTALRICMKNSDITELCAGTHNEESCYLLAELIDKNSFKRNDQRFWFAQLYGMSDHISFNLAAAGYNVAKYLPYGPVKEVLPYLARRAKENSSVKGQAGRELRLINQEINRRKLV